LTLVSACSASAARVRRRLPELLNLRRQAIERPLQSNVPDRQLNRGRRHAASGSIECLRGRSKLSPSPVRPSSEERGRPSVQARPEVALFVQIQRSTRPPTSSTITWSTAWPPVLPSNDQTTYAGSSGARAPCRKPTSPAVTCRSSAASPASCDPRPRWPERAPRRARTWRCVAAGMDAASTQAHHPDVSCQRHPCVRQTGLLVEVDANHRVRRCCRSA
jgi:hypothetical protein